MVIGGASIQLDREDMMALDEYNRLNELFYKDPEPSLYFRHRLDNLIYTAFAPEKLTALELDYERGPIRIVYSGVSELDSEDRQMFSRLAAIDATVLLHHSAETLLRLFLAHETLSPCPWISTASIVTPRAFKEAIRARFGSQSDRELERDLRAILQVFVGTADQEGTSLSDADWQMCRDSAQNIDAILTHLARIFLDDANLYNATKHGMTINPGEAFALINGHSIGNGPSITYIERVDAVLDNGEKAFQWAMKTAWIDIEHAILFIRWACELMDTMWGVAKGRYLAEPNSIRLHHLPNVDEAIKMLFKDGMPLMPRMRIPLTIIQRRPTSNR